MWLFVGVEVVLLVCVVIVLVLWYVYVIDVDVLWYCVDDGLGDVVCGIGYE